MTASQLARLLKGKRLGHGRYVAKCPVHIEKTPSLSIKSGRVGILVHCFGCGADVKEVAKAMGIPVTAFFYEGSYQPPITDTRWRDEQALELVYKRQAIWIALGLEKEDTFIDLCCEEAELLFKLHPVLREAYNFQHRIKTEGWDRIWDKYLTPDVDRKYPIVIQQQATLF